MAYYPEDPYVEEVSAAPVTSSFGQASFRVRLGNIPALSAEKEFLKDVNIIIIIIIIIRKHAARHKTGENTTHQHKHTYIEGTCDNRKQQFPRPVISTPDGDHIGRNM
jgi:hypothetical protein